MSALEWKIAEVEYSPPHALRLYALPWRSRVTTKVPLAFDVGPIKQPIREPRCADGRLCVAICPSLATGCVRVPLLPGGPENYVAFLSPNGGSHS